jgi:hypothetical protein
MTPDRPLPWRAVAQGLRNSAVLDANGVEVATIYDDREMAIAERIALSVNRYAAAYPSQPKQKEPA